MEGVLHDLFSTIIEYQLSHREPSLMKPVGILPGWALAVLIAVKITVLVDGLSSQVVAPVSACVRLKAGSIQVPTENGK